MTTIFPDLPEEVLREIFHFATYIHEGECLMPADPFFPKIISNNVMGPNAAVSAMHSKLAFSLVSRTWRGVAVPLLYRHLVVRSPRRANSVLSALESRSSSLLTDYGRFVRHLEIYTYSRGSRTFEFLTALCRIIQRCPNLRIISGTWTFWLPVGFLDAVSQMRGSTLEEISWSCDNCHADLEPTAKFFASFGNLRVLDISNLGFGRIDQPQTASLSLPSVRDLILSTHSISLSLATSLLMPNLRTLVLRVEQSVGLEWDHLYPRWTSADSHKLTTFLKAHGHSITTLHLLPPPVLDSDQYRPIDDFHVPFTVCSNIETVTFHVKHTPTFHHSTVRRVGLRGVEFDDLQGTFSQVSKVFISLADSSLYPSLETIRTLDSPIETNWNEAALDHFIKWTEKFERRGIDFQDGAGVVWLRY
ncbi:hypothetical protein GYMLUDRAFT_35409 [Collybiopsis luxurians FD-317 M1]|nr:hypothetical protein GYMLUDRAFT_35409 [Collybiopsis luxurians FD-317 M1]